MTRVLSGVALGALFVGAVWFLPPAAAVVLAGCVLLLAFVEYVGLARSAGTPFPTVPSGVATLGLPGRSSWLPARSWWS